MERASVRYRQRLEHRGCPESTDICSVSRCTGPYLAQGVGSGATRRTQACRAKSMNNEVDQDAEVRKEVTGGRDMTERFTGRAQAHCA